MKKGSLVSILATVVLVAAASLSVAGEEALPVDEAYKTMIEQRRQHESMADRLALTKAFLETYPDSKYTARLAGHVYYYQAERLGDVPGAIAYVEGLRANLTNPGFVTDFDRRMVELYGEAGMLDEMTSVAASLESAGEMKFSNYWSIIETATDHQRWEMVRAYCGKARPLANAATYRQDYPEYDFTDEEVEDAGANRAGMVAGKDAWALANLGKVDEALEQFATTESTLNRSYVGVQDYGIGGHWANALLMKGDYDAALERFAPEALIMGDEAALEGFKKAYVGKHGKEEGFEKFARKMHVEIAPKVKGWELPDYGGARVKFADIKGGVTLLAFWFPT